MEVLFNGKYYNTKYIPFFRVKKMKDYHIFAIRYPSGRIEKFAIVNTKNPIPELKRYLEFLIQEYLLEEKDALTPFGQKLKEDVHELFE